MKGKIPKANENYMRNLCALSIALRIFRNLGWLGNKAQAPPKETT